MAFGILWNGGVVRVNVATPKGVALWISNSTSSSPSSRLIHPFIFHPQRSVAILVRARSDQLTMVSGLSHGHSKRCELRCRGRSGRGCPGLASRLVPSHSKSHGKNFPRSVVVVSTLRFRLRPHKRRDPKPRRDRQTGNQKKTSVPQRLLGRRE